MNSPLSVESAIGSLFDRTAHRGIGSAAQGLMVLRQTLGSDRPLWKSQPLLWKAVDSSDQFTIDARKRKLSC